MNRGKLAAARAVPVTATDVDGLVLAEADTALVLDAGSEVVDAAPNDADADAADADANVDTELVDVDVDVAVIGAVAAGCDPSKECSAASAARCSSTCRISCRQKDR